MLVTRVLLGFILLVRYGGTAPLPTSSGNNGTISMLHNALTALYGGTEVNNKTQLMDLLGLGEIIRNNDTKIRQKRQYSNTASYCKGKLKGLQELSLGRLGGYLLLMVRNAIKSVVNGRFHPLDPAHPAIAKEILIDIANSDLTYSTLRTH